MTCRRSLRLISAYIDRELSAAEMRQMRNHLEQCACCAREYDTILATKRLLSGLGAKMPRQELEERILERIDEDQLQRSPAGVLSWWSARPATLRRRAALAGTGLMGACATLIVLALQPQPVAEPGPSTLSQWPGKAVAIEPAMPVQDMVFLHESWQRSQTSSRAVTVSESQSPVRASDQENHRSGAGSPEGRGAR